MKKFAALIIVGVFFSGLAQADSVSVAGFRAQPQEASNWCWAASIQSIFLTNGLEVTQGKIVTAAYGSPVNRTAPGFEGTLNILNGLTVSADASVWEITASAVNTFPNANWLYNELRNNRPVMIWYNDNISNHSIVINGGTYAKDGYGGIYWQQISAYDPWQKRNMTISAENIPRYVYGSFVIALKKRNSEKQDSAAEEQDVAPAARHTTPHGFKVPQWMK